MGVSPAESFKAQKPNFMEEESFDVDVLGLFIQCWWELLLWQLTTLGHDLFTELVQPRHWATCLDTAQHRLSVPTEDHVPRLIPLLIAACSLSCLPGLGASRVWYGLAILLFEVKSHMLCDRAQRCSAIMAGFPATKQVRMGKWWATSSCKGGVTSLVTMRLWILSSSLGLRELIPDHLSWPVILKDCQKMCRK